MAELTPTLTLALTLTLTVTLHGRDALREAFGIDDSPRKERRVLYLTRGKSERMRCILMRLMRKLVLEGSESMRKLDQEDAFLKELSQVAYSPGPNPAHQHRWRALSTVLAQAAEAHGATVATFEGKGLAVADQAA